MEKVNRRNVLSGLSLAAAAAGVAGAVAEPGLAAAGEGAGKKPNIVFFFGEGLRWDEFSFMGNAILQTPNFDRIANEGAVFQNAFCTNALCGPSRATALTGAYSHSTGATTNTFNKIPDNVPILTDVLHKNGYDVAFLGKSHVKGALTDRYFDYYFGFKGQADYMHPKIIEGVNGKYGPEKTYDKYVDDLLTDKAVEWLANRKSDRPFCLLLWFYAPHAPFYRPRRAATRFNGVQVPIPSNFDEDLTGYKGKPRAVADADNKMITTEMYSDDPRSPEELIKNHYVGVENNDENVGRVFKTLAQKGEFEDTVYLASSDHGFFLGEHSLYDKRLMYEESIRVPMMIRYPKRIKAGTKLKEMVLVNDIAPTILDIAGIKNQTPKTMDGRSILPLAEGKPVKNWRRDWLYEFFEYPGFENVRPSRGVRTERYKYIHYFLDPQEYELYDLVVDPSENTNLYGKPGYEEITRRLRTRLEELRRETNDTYEYKPSPRFEMSVKAVY